MNTLPTSFHRAIITGVVGAAEDMTTGDYVGVREDIFYDAETLPPEPPIRVAGVAPFGARPVSEGFKMIAAKPGQLCWIYFDQNQMRLDVAEGVYAEECEGA